MGVLGNCSPKITKDRISGVGLYGSLPPADGGQPPGGGGRDLPPLPVHLVRVALANFKEDAEYAVIGHFDSPANYIALGYGRAYIGEAKALGASYFAPGEIVWRRLCGAEDDVLKQMNDLWVDKEAEMQRPVLISRLEGRPDGAGLFAEVRRFIGVHGYVDMGDRLIPGNSEVGI